MVNQFKLLLFLNFLLLIIINYNLVMGNLFVKKNKLNEYAVNFVDYQQYTDLDDIDGLKHSMIMT